jgi:hypothetical protein
MNLAIRDHGALLVERLARARSLKKETKELHLEHCDRRPPGMCQPKTWIGQEGAFRMFAIIGIVLLLPAQPESGERALTFRKRCLPFPGAQENQASPSARYPK